MSAAADPRYHYRCRLVDVIDGDTVDLEVDLGFHARLLIRARLAGINAPERKARDARERDLALAATMHVADWCEARADRLIVRTDKDGRDKFGRLLATLIDQADGATVQASLMAAGLAVSYDGQTARRPWGSA
jgi:micrococcal nuclease